MSKHVLERAFAPLILAAALAACGSSNSAQPTAVPQPTAAPAPTTAPAAPTTLLNATEIPPATGTPAAPREVTLSDIANNPDAYAGQTVTVRGNVTDLIGPRSLALNDPALLGGDKVLVVGVSDGVVGLEGDTINATGTVSRFNLADIEHETGADLQDDLFADWAERPTIVAQQVDLVSGTHTDEVTFSQIADDAAAWAGKTVTVRGTMAGMVDERAFTLGEPGLGTDRFLIIAETVKTIPRDEPIFGAGGTGLSEWVQVTGVVRIFDLASVEQDLGVDLQGDLFGDYAGQPAIVAQTINVIGDQAAEGQEVGALATPRPAPERHTPARIWTAC